MTNPNQEETMNAPTLEEVYTEVKKAMIAALKAGDATSAYEMSMALANLARCKDQRCG